MNKSRLHSLQKRKHTFNTFVLTTKPNSEKKNVFPTNTNSISIRQILDDSSEPGQTMQQRFCIQFPASSSSCSKRPMSSTFCILPGSSVPVLERKRIVFLCLTLSISVGCWKLIITLGLSLCLLQDFPIVDYGDGSQWWHMVWFVDGEILVSSGSTVLSVLFSESFSNETEQSH